ncbi:MAG: glycosyl transferase family 1 [Chloroflexi bacterium]|nr:MAG: glycosyl transferase family 1 [Chloroflexota bacterium]RLC94500.1 MAG: glycosyl transferase family 1 [Chloroflexota bacterium]
MRPAAISPGNTIFVILSFEGPDGYSMAGGLGVRVTNLSRSLAGLGFHTHLLFIGDPEGKGVESTYGGRCTLHRWCQWISEYHPEGVYQGEDGKLADFNESAPPFVAEHLVRPALNQGKTVIILGEEWHTAEAMCRISDLLHTAGLRERVVMFWNANNTFSFDRINWGRLSYATTITTVSRYMKHIMRGMGLNPLVVPNGIPKSLLGSVDVKASASLRKRLEADLILAKVARWHPDKRWNEAVEAVARLKARGLRTVLVARGGIEPHGEEVLYHARSLGLKVADARSRGGSLQDCLNAIEGGDKAEVINLRFRCPQDFLRIVYHASDAVLANSGHEPFGLVGLEAMAAGGIAFTGGTGEDYAVPFRNSIVLETADPGEIEAYAVYLNEHPNDGQRIRKAARQTARQFTWEEVITILVRKLEYQARAQGLLAAPVRAAVQEPRHFDLPDLVPQREPVVAVTA